MSWQAASLGILLGLGVLLAAQGFRVVIDKDQDETARRAAFRKLSGGLILAALSMIAIAWIAPH